MIFQYDQQVPVLFGEGAIGKLGEKVKELGCKKVMCVYGSSVKKSGIADKAKASLAAAGIDFAVYEGIQADPTDAMVNECGSLGVQEKVDGYIGIGGGSAMDCAKAAALLLDHEGPIQKYFTAPPSFMVSSVPVILIPTTAGSGSECSQVSVITRTEDHTKPSIFMRSTLAIVDPELTLSVPAGVTANSGMDAFSHAVEAITAKGRNPRSELLASACLEKIRENLPKAIENGNDLAARTELCLAANWAGIAFTDTDLHLGHNLADGLSATFHTPHGYNCILVEPELMKLCASVIPDKVAVVGKGAGAAFDGTETSAGIGEKTAAAIRSLMKTCGIPTPESLGLDREKFIGSAAIAMQIDLGLRLNCPVDVDEEIMRTIYAGAYDNYR